jgi:hypothetical protein
MGPINFSQIQPHKQIESQLRYSTRGRHVTIESQEKNLKLFFFFKENLPVAS